MSKVKALLKYFGAEERVSLMEKLNAKKRKVLKALEPRKQKYEAKRVRAGLRLRKIRAKILKQIEKLLLRIILDILEQQRRSRVSFGSATYIDSADEEDEENEVSDSESVASETEVSEREEEVQEEEPVESEVFENPMFSEVPEKEEKEEEETTAPENTPEENSPMPTRVGEKTAVVVAEKPRTVLRKNEDVGILKVGKLSYRLEGRVTETHTTEDVLGEEVRLQKGQRVRIHDKPEPFRWLGSLIDSETMNQLVYLETRYLKIEKFMFKPSKPSPIISTLQKLLLDTNAFDWIDMSIVFGDRIFPEEE